MNIYCLIIGIGIRLLGIIAHRGKFTGEIIATQKLVTTGIYSIIRHPCYLGSFFITMGLCGINGIGVAVTLLAWVLYSDRADREEIIMAEKFGQDYLDYVLKTDRFIPFKLLKRGK